MVEVDERGYERDDWVRENVDSKGEMSLGVGEGLIVSTDKEEG